MRAGLGKFVGTITLIRSKGQLMTGKRSVTRRNHVVEEDSFIEQTKFGGIDIGQRPSCNKQQG